MFNHELYASTLARAVDLMRQKDAKEQQKSALRALVTLAAAGSATVRCYDGVLSIDDISIDTAVPHTGSLAGRLAAHNIAEIAIGRGAEPAELYGLLRGLADDPYGGTQVKDRLREAKSTRIWVLLQGGDDAPLKRGSLSQLFEPPPEVASAPTVPGQRPPVAGSKGAQAEAAEAYAMWEALHSASGSSSTIQEIDLGFDETPEPEPAAAAAAPVPEAPPAAVPQLPIDADTPLGKALLQLAMHPHSGDVLERLTALVDPVKDALANGRLEDVLHALAMVAGFEQGAEEGTPRNSYRIILRRIMARETMMQLAPLATDPRLGDLVARVLSSTGGEGTDVLLGLLATSESSRERKVYMNALRNMPHGRDRIPVMLGHSQWFVVRNIAELVGEMKLEEATPDLAKLLGHEDQRVRRAAAIALAKIGTNAASEPLRAAMKDGAPDLRILIASQVGSGHAAAFTAPLMAQLDTEEDPEALKEICGALVRIGTPEALAALTRASKGGGLFSRRGRAAKEAAEAALKKGKKVVP